MNFDVLVVFVVVIFVMHTYISKSIDVY